MSTPKVEVVYPTQHRAGAPDPPTLRQNDVLAAKVSIRGERLRRACEIIEELLRTDGWRSARSGSEKSQAYIRARRKAIEFLGRGGLRDAE